MEHLDDTSTQAINTLMQMARRWNGLGYIPEDFEGTPEEQKALKILTLALALAPDGNSRFLLALKEQLEREFPKAQGGA